ncbi:MAG: (d)CMP kinase [Gemmatimonas sp.]|nr:(d)CMP kinase [Gemmatimonas sp.]
MVIAIDGPAASGKSSTAKAVAAELGYRYLDSGAFYRALTLAALNAGLPTRTWSSLTTEQVRNLAVAATPVGAGYDLSIAGAPVGDEIRSSRVNAHVSRLAAVPAVRGWLLDALREAGRDGGLVADGRDIGTVVFPDAELKIFLVCDPEERALRRLRQRGRPEPDVRQIREEARHLLERDRLDQSREIAPLIKAHDAILLDTTDLSLDAQVGAIVRLARARARP